MKRFYYGRTQTGIRGAMASLIVFFVVLLLFLAAFLASGAMALQTGQELSGKVVRLHVLANSDTEEEQARKLKVRDRILAYAEPLLAGAGDRREAEALLRGQVLELERIAAAVMSGQVRYCPHGRPVAITLTRKELEKQFKRA